MEQDHLLSLVSQSVGTDKQILVAYSGGVDSTVLLHLLTQLRDRCFDLKLRAIHIHHGLSENADAWAKSCQRLCDAWKVPLHIVHVEVPLDQVSLEASARNARYQAINSIIQPGETLAVAQHQDDQAETFLLALKRGSGPAGLAAMAPRMPYQRGHIVRPLIHVSRQQIEAYAHQHHFDWVEDESNQQDRFDRNFLRLKVTPLLRERWPHFARMTARSAMLCAEQEELLDELLQDSLQQLQDENEAISISGLQKLSAIKRRALLRRWFACHNSLMPTREQLSTLWNEIALSREDADPRMHLPPWQIRRYRDRLYLLPEFASLRGKSLTWDTTHPLSLPDGLGRIHPHVEGINLRAPKADEPVSVRFGAAPGKLNIIGRNGSRQLKKLWQEFGIPPGKETGSRCSIMVRP
nr:tRNA lysidine(34) synthetase TilS [Dongshaea marina]